MIRRITRRQALKIGASAGAGVGMALVLRSAYPQYIRRETVPLHKSPTPVTPLFAQSPIIQKFVVGLPGLGPSNAANSQYIPMATPTPPIVKDVWPAILVTGVTFAVPQYVISNYINPWIVDIGASDAYLSGTQVAEHPGLKNIALAISAQQLNHNVPGFNRAHLKLSGQVLSDIYQGKITEWNDSAIAKLNPGANLPADKIIALHRSDSSGDTFLFISFIDAAAPNGGFSMRNAVRLQ